MTQKMKTSELFAACIPLIKDGGFGYICHALFFLEYGDQWRVEWEKDDREAPGVDIVMNRLNGNEHLYGAIVNIRDGFCDILKIESWYTHQTYSHIDMKPLRIVWLESLVAEFQQRGD